MPDGAFDALRARLRRKEDYAATFGGAAGRRVLADLARFAGANAEIFVPGDPFSTAFNAGKHRVVQRIASILAMDQGDLIAMARSDGFQHDRSE